MLGTAFFRVIVPTSGRFPFRCPIKVRTEAPIYGKTLHWTTLCSLWYHSFSSGINCLVHCALHVSLSHFPYLLRVFSFACCFYFFPEPTPIHPRALSSTSKCSRMDKLSHNQDHLGRHCPLQLRNSQFHLALYTHQYTLVLAHTHGSKSMLLTASPNLPINNKHIISLFSWYWNFHPQ